MPNVSKLGKGPKHCPRKLLIFLFIQLHKMWAGAVVINITL